MPGPLRRNGILWILPILLLCSGCTYLGNRADDFVDCWRAEGRISLIPGAWVVAGPVVHTGVGISEGPIIMTAGLRYNYRSPEGSSVYSYDGNPHGGVPEFSLLAHASGPGFGKEDHFCYALLPPLINREGVHRNWLHDFDFEVGASALVGGTLGFSLGEFADFLLGLFGLDIAGDDDPAARRSRNYFDDRAGRPGFNKAETKK
jgi:hypothetical protein